MDNISEAVEHFKKGKVGIFPTDTAFGIGCRMDNIDSIKKVFQLRNRPEEKALLVLVGSLKMAEEYVVINEKIKNNLIDKYWPGGLTLVLKCKKEKVPEIVRSGGETLAVRFPDHQILQKIIQGVGVPIVAPSANYSGEKTPLKFSDVDQGLLDKVDFSLKGVCTMEGVSTIVDAASDQWKIVRDGVVKVAGL